MINVNTTVDDSYVFGQSIYPPNLSSGHHVISAIGLATNNTAGSMAYFGYVNPGIGTLGLNGWNDIITYTWGSIKLNQPTTVSGNLTVTGKVTSNGSNTVTHYAPIESGQDISLFKVASGHVYKRVETSMDHEENPVYEWQPSTVTDRSDCICSVVNSGSHKEFVGIVTEIDVENNCITFASHGDFLFTVDDTTQYQVGDVICYDGTVLNEDEVMTLKVQQFIVGKVTSKIDETTFALFRS